MLPYWSVSRHTWPTDHENNCSDIWHRRLTLVVSYGLRPCAGGHGLGATLLPSNWVTASLLRDLHAERSCELLPIVDEFIPHTHTHTDTHTTDRLLYTATQVVGNNYEYLLVTWYLYVNVVIPTTSKWEIVVLPLRKGVSVWGIFAYSKLAW